MKTLTKICLIVSVLLLLAGTILFVCGMSVKDWDFQTLNTVIHEPKEYVAQGEIAKITVDVDTSDVRVKTSESSNVLTCNYTVAKDLVSGKTAQISISEDNGELTIAESPLAYSPFQWNTQASSVLLVIPSDIASLQITTRVGKIELDALNVRGTLNATTDTGAISVTNCTVTESITLSGNVCDIRLQDTEAQKIAADIDVGNISCQGILSAAQLTMNTDLGNIDLSGGETDAIELTLSCSLGNIRAALAGAREDYAADVECDAGESNLYPSASGTRKLTVRCNMGNIDISFTK